METTIKFDRLARIAGIPELEIAARCEDIQEFTDRLCSLSERSRKLLASTAELAYHGRGQERKPDVAYLPELYESCGLGVEEMYPLLTELRGVRLIDVEDKYPFEGVRILPAASGFNALAAISSFCEARKLHLRDVIVDLRFELLA